MHSTTSAVNDGHVTMINRHATVHFFAISVISLRVLVSTVAHAGPPAGISPLPCLGEVCLGESIRNLRGIPWIKLPEQSFGAEVVPVQKFDPGTESEAVREFPRFEEIAAPIQGMFSASKNPSGSMLLVSIRSNSDLSALHADLRSGGMFAGTNRIGPEAIAELAIAQPALCNMVRFEGHFLSKSGYATTVEFMSIARSATEHDLVVEYIGRRILMPTEAGVGFEKMLRRQYPQLVKFDDLETHSHCGAQNFFCGAI